MNHYIEVTLIDNSNISLHQIWSKLYSQLHLAFVERQDKNGKILYGVSFPKYRINNEKQIGFLGDKLRIFANSKAELENLDLPHWLSKLRDYLHITSIKEVPIEQTTGYLHFYKVKQKLKLEQRIKHQAERRGISFEEAGEHFKSLRLTKQNQPYIQLTSLSNSHKFRLLIEKNSSEKPMAGKFNTYGLSRISSVPDF